MNASTEPGFELPDKPGLWFGRNESHPIHVIKVVGGLRYARLWADGCGGYAPVDQLPRGGWLPATAPAPPADKPAPQALDVEGAARELPMERRIEAAAKTIYGNLDIAGATEQESMELLETILRKHFRSPAPEGELASVVIGDNNRILEQGLWAYRRPEWSSWSPMFVDSDLVIADSGWLFKRAIDRNDLDSICGRVPVSPAVSPAAPAAQGESELVSSDGIPSCPWCGADGENRLIRDVDRKTKPAICWQCGSLQFTGEEPRQCINKCRVVELETAVSNLQAQLAVAEKERDEWREQAEPCRLVHCNCGACGMAITEDDKCGCGDCKSTVGRLSKDLCSKYLMQNERLQAAVIKQAKRAEAAESQLSEVKRQLAAKGEQA